jgi:hypothetical protein
MNTPIGRTAAGKRRSAESDRLRSLADSQVPPSARWRRWSAANTVGFALGGAAFGAIQRNRMQPYFEVLTSATDAARIVAVNTGFSMAIFGGLVGVAQALALRCPPVGGWQRPFSGGA